MFEIVTQVGSIGFVAYVGCTGAGAFIQIIASTIATSTVLSFLTFGCGSYFEGSVTGLGDGSKASFSY